MIDPTPRPAHPAGLNRMVLLCVLAAGMVPAAHAWLERRRRAPLIANRTRIEASLESAQAADRHRVPDRWTETVEDQRWSWVADLARAEVRLDQLFPDEMQREWRGRRGAGESFAGLLEAPRDLAGAVSRERIQLSWRAPEGLPRLLAEAGRDPLLRVRYRIYRSRDGEEPRLLDSCATEKSTFEDRDLPTAREELRYSVATALEGQYGELPTLLDSAGSELYSIHTLENFKVEILGTIPSADAAGLEAGFTEEPRRARLLISAWDRGGWLEQEFEAAPGQILGATREIDGRSVDFSTGLRLSTIRVTPNPSSETVRRPEFLPDGSRKLDASGGPTFTEQTRTVPSWTVELLCRDDRGQERIFRSTPLR